MSYGTVRWAMHNRPALATTTDRIKITADNIKTATLRDPPEGAHRWVRIAGNSEGVEQDHVFSLEPQDDRGDGTVSPKSGAAPKGKPGVKRVFKTQGFDHQGCYNNKQMALLTKHLIVKMVAEKAKVC